jgi:putative tryptophan/tyrosine transport system substrate-binding protein
MIGRRKFITLLGGAVAAWPVAARAQPPGRVRRVGVLMNLAADDPEGQARLAAFREELEKLGWRIGINLQIDYQSDVFSPDRAQTATAELLRLAPNIILANGTNALRAVQQASDRIAAISCTISFDIASTGLRAASGLGASTIAGLSNNSRATPASAPMKAPMDNPVMDSP